MLLRLINAWRIRAGWALALVYVLCISAPNVALALGAIQQITPCILDEHDSLGIGHRHEMGDRQHTRSDRYSVGAEDYVRPARTVHASGQLAAESSRQVPLGDTHKTQGTQCCGMGSAAGLPANVFGILAPFGLASIYPPADYRDLPDSGQPRQDRPPIS